MGDVVPLPRKRVTRPQQSAREAFVKTKGALLNVSALLRERDQAGKLLAELARSPLPHEALRA